MPAKKQAKQAKQASKAPSAKVKSSSVAKTVPAKVPTGPKRMAAVPAPKVISSGVKKTKSDEQLVKVVTKGGAAVDLLVPSKDSYRVFQDSSKTYSATLNQSNLDANNNKFYIIQILQHEGTGQFSIWNRWGRVGVPGQHALKGPMPKDMCIREFTKKHYEKAVKGDYREIEIKYDDTEEKEKEQKKSAPTKKNTAKSTMDAGLQGLMNLIFDVNIMNTAMKEIGYDAKKMPLGRLGESTIKEAYGVLNQLAQAVKKKDQAAQKKLSGDFYSLIPHDFGFKNMATFVLDNDEKVRSKLTMLQTISDLKITSKLLDQKGNDNESVLDQNYKKLGCSIKNLDRKSIDYKMMKEYFDNTKSNYSKVEISDIFQVVRPAEQTSFTKKIGNNTLLWHGSRVSNFVGILSQGMRIAPPEAPVSGYAFGKGIYLADMAEKSINYCRAHGSNEALILLIEGAIGNPNVLSSSSYQAKELMEKAKKDSTLYKGTKAPPKQSYKTHKNMTVPYGKPDNSGGWGSHSEYIIYNVNQAKIRYILRMKMNGQ